MKAEHRKELQTNALADRIGRFFKGMRSKGQSSGLMVWVIVLVAVGLLVTWWLFRRSAREHRSEMWVAVDAAVSGEPRANPHASPREDPLKTTVDDLEKIIRKHPGTKAALTARFRLAQLYLRTEGLDKLPTAPTQALLNLTKARAEFEKLDEECKDDPYWKPQALLGIAKIVETMAVQDAKNLRKAADLYKELAADYPASAAGREAAERSRQLRDEDAREEIEAFYKTLRDSLALSPRHR